MVGGFGNITKIPELMKRIWFTVFMLGLYRIFIFIPVPGVNAKALLDLLNQGQSGSGPQGLFGIYDMFWGGALQQFSVIPLGIMPYSSASIILQLLGVVVPYLENLQKEGEAGRRKIPQYTRYGSILLAAVQGAVIAFGLTRMAPQGHAPVVAAGLSAFAFVSVAVISLCAGSAFLMWIGEQITERGIGNGIPLLIYA